MYNCCIATYLKEIYMIDFGFEEQYKKYQQAVDRTIQAYDFWFSSIVSTAKALFTSQK
jgi:hypothetical protein